MFHRGLAKNLYRQLETISKNKQSFGDGTPIIGGHFGANLPIPM